MKIIIFYIFFLFCFSGLFLFLVFCNGSFIIGRSFTLGKCNCPCRAFREAISHTVAVIIAHEPGLAVNKPYRALVACVDALSAAVALFLVYLNNSSYHLHCLQLIFTLQHYDIPGVKLAV